MRLALIKVAEITVGSTAEPLPGNLITLQTPVIETPSALTPRIRLSMGGPSGQDVNSETEGESRHKRDLPVGYGFPIVDQPAVSPVKLLLTAAPKKNKSVHKSQSRGLPDADVAAIRNALKKLVGLYTDDH